MRAAFRPLLWFWLPLLLVLQDGRPAAADEESDRKDLLYKIDGRLDYAASELSGFESDSDAGDVDDALSYVREVESYVEQLGRVKGSDSTANSIVSYYPGYIREFRTAADEQKKLKAAPRALGAAHAPSLCPRFEGDVQSQGASYVRGHVRALREMSDIR